MALKPRSRKQLTLNYDSGNKVTETLGRGMIYRALYLRLSGALTIGATDNTRANTLLGDEWAVATKIEIIANGTDVIKSIAGKDLWWLNYFLYRVAPQIAPDIGGAGDNPAFDTVLILPFWMIDGSNPMDTALDSRTLSSLEIAVTWGSHTSINASASGFGTSPSIDVYSEEVFNVNVNAQFANWRTFLIEKEITATNAQFQVDIPIGGLYRGFMLNTTDANADQGDILNNYKVVSGTTVFADIKAQDDVLNQLGRLERGIPRNYDLGANAFQPLKKSSNSSIVGWYWHDFVKDGLLTEAIDTLGLSEFKLECDVTVGTGTTKIRVYPMQIIPVRGQRNNA